MEDAEIIEKATEEDEPKAFKPSIKTIDDIYYRLAASLPVTGFTLREQLVTEWKVLEERLKDFKNTAREDEARLEGIEQGRKQELENWEGLMEANCEQARQEGRLEVVKEIEKSGVWVFEALKRKEVKEK